MEIRSKYGFVKLPLSPIVCFVPSSSQHHIRIWQGPSRLAPRRSILWIINVRIENKLLMGSVPHVTIPPNALISQPPWLWPQNYCKGHLISPTLLIVSCFHATWQRALEMTTGFHSFACGGEFGEWWIKISR